MNVQKRVEALKAIRARTKAHSLKAQRIADELDASAESMTPARNKAARKIAHEASSLALALDTAARV